VHRLRERLVAAEGAAARVEALSALANAGKASVAEDLVRHLSDPDASVRERAAVLLGDVSAHETLPRLAARFSCESDVAVREAIVRAVGLLGDETAVPWVVERGDDPALFKAACYALARIRTPGAIERLTAWRERAAAAVPRDDATVRLVDYLRGRSFEEAERVAGHPVGPRTTTKDGAAAPAGRAAGPEGTRPR
jgi:HEAT repeat protein